MTSRKQEIPPAEYDLLNPPSQQDQLDIEQTTADQELRDFN